MKTCKTIFIILTLFLVTTPAHAISGNEYKAMSHSEQLLWTVGVTDGVLATELILTNKQPPIAIFFQIRAHTNSSNI